MNDSRDQAKGRPDAPQHLNGFDEAETEGLAISDEPRQKTVMSGIEFVADHDAAPLGRLRDD